ncbi:nucleotidyl transferase AbiEii/AbiGii toxin family protein [Candidatus Curtissbacteria bacterium]|nr:nucleotidyl transferase AbiEii/AbiGii toxin family protein [Candidatus Curtissbacteria bacterium]
MIDVDKHKFILIQILKDIYTDKDLGPILGFKGGSAVYLFYNLPRFSVDLDFSLLNERKKKVVFEKVKEILVRHGRLKEVREKRFTLFYLLSYDEKLANIKVEISKRKFPDQYEVLNYLGIPMLVMKREDMVAHKLVTLLERKEIANRDLFDLWYFLSHKFPINRELVEFRTREKFDEYFNKCIKVIERVDARYILQGLGEILDDRQKAWVRQNLKKELLFLMKFYLTQSA